MLVKHCTLQINYNQETQSRYNQDTIKKVAGIKRKKHNKKPLKVHENGNIYLYYNEQCIKFWITISSGVE